MIIYFDLTESKVSKVRLLDREQVIEELTGNGPLPLIDQLLKKHGLSLGDIEEFDINPGPGSFTGIKVAATVANVLNWQKGVEKEIKPNYGNGH